MLRIYRKHENLRQNPEWQIFRNCLKQSHNCKPILYNTEVNSTLEEYGNDRGSNNELAVLFFMYISWRNCRARLLFMPMKCNVWSLVYKIFQGELFQVFKRKKTTTQDVRRELLSHACMNLYSFCNHMYVLFRNSRGAKVWQKRFTLPQHVYWTWLRPTIYLKLNENTKTSWDPR